MGENKRKSEYKIGKKTYDTWDEFDEAIREFADKNIDELEEVKFEFGCCKCNKVIKGKPRSRTTEDNKGRSTGLYCKKCFRSLFHPDIK